jgi:hypothetical protein
VVALQVVGDAMLIVLALATPGSSRTKLDRRGRLAAPRASLLGERALPRIESERWSVRDQGFMAARNRLCAARDGITPRDTLERHIAGIGKLAERAGLAVDENAWAFYRRFARSGGEMSFGGAYQPPLSVEESLSGRDHARALARMNATLERDTRAVPIVWRMVSPTPGGDAAAASTASANAPETVTPPASAPAGELPVAAAPAMPAPAASATVVPSPVAATPTVRPTQTSPAAVAPPSESPPIAAPTEPSSAATAPAASVPVAAPPVETARPVPADPAPTVAAPAEPATPSVTPPPARTSGARIERAPPVTRRESLEFAELASHQGRQVRLWTMHNPPRTVQILGGDANEIRVRAKLGGGQAEYTVKREGFLRASLVR